ALGRAQRDDLTDLGIVDRVLEPVGQHRIAVGHIEADVDLEPLADLALGLRNSVMRVDGEAANLDLDGRVKPLAVRLHGPGPYQRNRNPRATPWSTAPASPRRESPGSPRRRQGPVAARRRRARGTPSLPRAAPTHWRRSCRRAARRPPGP